MRPKLIGKQTALQASVALAMMSVISKAMGLGREMLIARNLGASTEYDLYLTVTMLPSAAMTALAYTVSKAITPYYQRARVGYGDRAASAYGWRITLVGCAVLGILAAVCAAFAEPIVYRLLPQAAPDELASAARMFRFTSLYPPLYFWFSSLGTYLRSERYFIASSLGLLIQNVCVILTLVLLRNAGSWALVWGWILALTTQGMLITAIHWRTGHPLQLRSLLAERFPRDYFTGLLIGGVQIIFIEMWGQLWTIIDRAIAQYLALPDGTIASLTLANALFIIPISMFNLGIGRVVFPLMAGHIAAGDSARAQRILHQALRAVAAALIPITAFMAVASTDIVGALYLRGAFDKAALATTSSAMGILILGLPLAGCYVIQSAHLYAQRRYGIMGLSAVAGGAVKLAASYGLGQMGAVQGLAAATCLAHLTCVTILYVGIPELHWSLRGVRYLLKIMLATGLATAAAWLANRFAPSAIQNYADGTWLNHLAGGAIAAVAFGGVLAVAGLALRIQELRQAMVWLIRRVHRS